MVCSLNCFCDFFEAQTTERRTSVVKQYKRSSASSAKGMSVYYRPVLRLIRGTLCPGGTYDQKLAALREACIRPTATDKLNDACIAANMRVFKAFRSEFGKSKLKVFPNPRMQYLAGESIAINLQPELHAEVDGVRMMWKFGLCKHSRPQHMVRGILQMFGCAAHDKGLDLPNTQIRFLDTMDGMVYVEETFDASLQRELRRAAAELSKMWDATK